MKEAMKIFRVSLQFMKFYSHAMKTAMNTHQDVMKKVMKDTWDIS